MGMEAGLGFCMLPFTAPRTANYHQEQIFLLSFPIVVLHLFVVCGLQTLESISAVRSLTVRISLETNAQTIISAL